VVHYDHMNIIFFDTETTGNESHDRLCQIAYTSASETVSELFLPPIPISIESMAVHHITQNMVAQKPLFTESPLYQKIKETFESESSIMVAHNAQFDITMLEKENIHPKHIICTLRVARHLDAEGSIPSYRLQYLRYYLGIEIQAVAHDALGDVLVLEQLFSRLFKKIQEKYSYTEDQALKFMEEISAQPSLLHTMPFGKHKDKKIKDLATEDPGYLTWLLNQKKEQSVDGDEDWIYTLEYYTKK
jgi:DNA polymerase III epsilon subunit-like protein